MVPKRELICVWLYLGKTSLDLRRHQGRAMCTLNTLCCFKDYLKKKIRSGIIIAICVAISRLLITEKRLHQSEWMNWCIIFVAWLTEERRLDSFPAGTIIKDPHHRQSPTRREQDLNLHITWVQALLNEVVQ